MPQTKHPIKVFLSYARNDLAAVHSLYSRLKKAGVDVWFDKEELIPGSDWELEIRKAVRSADVVIVCLSNEFNQAGFRQKEVRLALDTAMEKPEGDIFIIPARLEECESAESLSKWQWVDLFEVNGYQRLIQALHRRADSIGATLPSPRGRSSAASYRSNTETAKSAGEIATKPKSRGKRKRSSEAIIVALIGLAGTIVAAGLQLFERQIPASGLISTSTLQPEVVAIIQTMTALPDAPDLQSTIEFLQEKLDKALATPTLLPVEIPSPRTYDRTYDPLWIFAYGISNPPCWVNDTGEFFWVLNGYEEEDNSARFTIDKDRTAEEFVRTDFNGCMYQRRTATAFSLNAGVVQLQLQNEVSDQPDNSEREFGIFIEDTNGQRREYTVWVDRNGSLHLRVREGNQVTFDDTISIVSNIKIDRSFPDTYAQFGIQFFFEINNQGLDLLYLGEGPLDDVSPNDISPSRMILIDAAVRPTLGKVNRFGIVGYGGETEVMISPLVLYGE
jgi:hypothetical protein